MATQKHSCSSWSAHYRPISKKRLRVSSLRLRCITHTLVPRRNRPRVRIEKGYSIDNEYSVYTCLPVIGVKRMGLVLMYMVFHALRRLWRDGKNKGLGLVIRHCGSVACTWRSCFSSHHTCLLGASVERAYGCLRSLVRWGMVGMARCFCGVGLGLLWVMVLEYIVMIHLVCCLCVADMHSSLLALSRCLNEQYIVGTRSDFTRVALGFCEAFPLCWCIWYMIAEGRAQCWSNNQPASRQIPGVF